ncbi:uncharacterized protein [Clinocottus analis]|uniref:uncharacterized protein n=1 Tax=Clinocottus analis TaxID=304258 RepID=UPI0035BF185A
MTSSGTADHDKRLGKHASRSVMGTMGCQKTCKVEKLLKQSQWEVAWSQRQRLATTKKNSQTRGADKSAAPPSATEGSHTAHIVELLLFISLHLCYRAAIAIALVLLFFCPPNTVGNTCLCIGPLTAAAKLRNEVLPLQLPGVQPLDNFHLPEDNGGALGLNSYTLSHQRLKQKLLETEISTRRKECEALEAEVKKKNQTCQTLENELQDFLQENKHLNLQLFNSSHKTSEYEKVKSEYAQLKETLGAVTQERDLALWERNKLQGKLENLEQVLKVRKPSPRADLTALSLSTVCISSPSSLSIPGS